VRGIEAGLHAVVAQPAGTDAEAAGAAAARHPILLFLHADTRLPAGWPGRVAAAFRDPATVGGAFRFRVTETGWRWRLLERMVRLRSSRLALPYGDQALFCRAEAFRRVDGFPDLPVMEDYAFVRVLRREGRLRLLDEAAVSSARLWQQAGYWRVTLVHQLIIAGYHLGMAPGRLAAWRRHLLDRKPR
jgi:hypothetical protein